jgi:hypothetical protein
MKRPRPTNEPTDIELIFVVLVFALALLFSSCCPKIVPQTPQIVDRWETAWISLPPPPPIIIPADSAAITFDINQLCDSTWRARYLQQQSAGKRLKASADITGSTLRFTCKEDSLIHVLDSIRSIQVNHSREIKQEIYVEKCPYRWPKWFHLLLILLGLVSAILSLILFIKKSD